MKGIKKINFKYIIVFVLTSLINTLTSLIATEEIKLDIGESGIILGYFGPAMILFVISNWYEKFKMYALISFITPLVLLIIILIPMIILMSILDISV